MNINLQNIEHGVLLSKADGTQYVGTQLTFTKEGDNTPSTRVFPSAALNNNPVLAEQLQTLVPGQKYDMQFSSQPNARGFRDVVGFGPPKPPQQRPAFTPGGGKQGSSFDQRGAQRGNSLSNAVLLVTSSHPAYKGRGVEEVARELIAIGDRLEAADKQRTAAPTQAPAARSPQQPVIIHQEIEYPE